MTHILRHHRLAILFFFIPWGAYFLFLWSHMLFFKDGDLIAGHPYVWADWSMHIALAANFAFRPMTHWFDSLPVYANAPVTYPFVTNLVSGLLWKIGLSLPQAFILPSIVWTAGLLGALYLFFRSLLRSEKSAILAALLFFCSGGLGIFFTMYEKGIASLFDSTQILTQIGTHQIEVNNSVASMLFPQRAFLLGLPIGLGILWLVLNTFVYRWKKSHQGVLGCAGLLAGLLPIIHTHTYLVVVLFSLWLFAQTYRQLRSWLVFAVPATFISAVIYLVFLRQGISSDAFFSYHPGWIGHGTLAHWSLFWLKNWGIFLPVAFIGTLLIGYQKKMKLFSTTLFFWLLFVLANLIQFQPQEWDNTKLFAWVYIGLTIPVVILLQELYHRKIALFWKSMVGILVLVMIASGGVDVIHNLDLKRKSFTMLTRDQIELGNYVRERTAPTSVFFTRPIVGNPISMVGGRSVYLGYPGWAFSYGLDFSTRETAISSVFSERMQLSQLPSAAGIQYVFIEKNESEQDWIQTLPRAVSIFENDAGSVYEIK